MRRPRLRHRRVVRAERHRRVVLAELVVCLCELARRLPASIGVSGLPASIGVSGPSAWLAGGTAVPVVVRDGLIGAADEQLRAGAGGAVVRRPVQRRPPARRGGHGRHRRHHQPSPTTRRTAPTAKGAPAAVLGVHLGARVEQRCDGRAIVVDRRNDQRRPPIPANGVRSGRLKRGLEGPGILGIPPAAYPAQQSATTASVKRRS